MNILFYTPSQVSVQAGGTERITATVAAGLMRRGYHCFFAYAAPVPENFVLAPCDGDINISKESMTDYIVEKKIDVVILQTMNRMVRELRQFIDEHRLACKLISVLHYNPGYENVSVTFRRFMNDFKNDHGVSKLMDALRLVSFPLYKSLYPKRNAQLYREVYHYSDQVVLLSAHFIPEYQQVGRFKDDKKFRVIPNALSFDSFATEEDLKRKEHRVLVVSRLEEMQKRISMVLRIWREIEKIEDLKDWQLDIVGWGPDSDAYQQTARELGLQRVHFEGRQDPKPYYLRSSILLMTSAFEGWGLTLTEAQQYGCVPMAFDSFASLRDIISDGENGVVIPNNDIPKYVDNLSLLMTDEGKRQKMAMEAVRSSHRFEQSCIVDKWDDLMSS